ncbi:DNA-binding transcriptional regulator, FrmR family [Halobacillus karajensis]|uniref:metal-sensitive transcriptional regulator n=1 Tax=Halobacillus karajensis TaxID=195088 RepID=UPI0008A7DB56|nr:metal-sensitive transcriptional regulator [Halobacillus karajensis]SEH77238.1 DNA-binding transcriptional regulator, FrmR family [Halobacillus karajensis]
MEFSQDLKLRLKRAEGQVRGVHKMMEEEKECKNVISQLSAVRSAVDRTIATIVAENLQRCIQEQADKGEDTTKVVQEAIELLVKSR